ncbi:MAG TPA: hypothetical protein VL625_00595 [Patescibacteria group bacterium]|nr:hypothetical protein [Patescibacteria group bacterium]
MQQEIERVKCGERWPGQLIDDEIQQHLQRAVKRGVVMNATKSVAEMGRKKSACVAPGRQELVPRDQDKIVKNKFVVPYIRVRQQNRADKKGEREARRIGNAGKSCGHCSVVVHARFDGEAQKQEPRLPSLTG